MCGLLTVAEAAARLGRSRGFVLDLAADGLIAGFKRNRRWYVTAASLDAWLAAPVEPNPASVVTPPMVWRRPDAA